MLKVHITNRQDRVPVARATLRKLLRAAAPTTWRNGEIGLVVVDRAEMQTLNRRHTGRKGVTDVLAFPLADDMDGTVGEVVVCADVAIEAALRRGHPPERELALYAVHGVLHLAGYDDAAPADRRAMYAREEEVLRGVGLGGARAGSQKRNGSIGGRPGT